jgi:hypothetical protein
MGPSTIGNRLGRFAALATMLAIATRLIAGRRQRSSGAVVVPPDRRAARTRATCRARRRQRGLGRTVGTASPPRRVDGVPADAGARADDATPVLPLRGIEVRLHPSRVASNVLDVIEDACAAGVSQTEALDLGAAHLSLNGWRYADARGYVFQLYEDL